MIPECSSAPQTGAMRTIVIVLLLAALCAAECRNIVHTSANMSEESVASLSEGNEQLSMSAREVETAELLFARIESLHAAGERLKENEAREGYINEYGMPPESAESIQEAAGAFQDRTNKVDAEYALGGREREKEREENAFLRRERRDAAQGRVYTYNEDTSAAYDIYHATDVHPIASKLTYHAGKRVPVCMCVPSCSLCHPFLLLCSFFMPRIVTSLLLCVLLYQ